MSDADAPAPPSHDASAFRVSLPAFEGPLDLLLHLIQKHELDVLDLPIAFVTERYLEYLELMRELDLDVASEYLLMAATLAHIKSKMLLPTPPIDQDDDLSLELGADPRGELIRRLLEYQKYKAVAEELGARGIQGRDVFLRGATIAEADEPPPLAELGLFTLLDAFQKVLARGKHDLAREVTADRMSMQERMTQITDLLTARRSCAFDDLFDGAVTRYDLVVTFLALLEMAKTRMVRVYQADPTAAIHIELALLAADAPDEQPDSSSATEHDPEPGPEPEPKAENTGG